MKQGVHSAVPTIEGGVNGSGAGNGPRLAAKKPARPIPSPLRAVLFDLDGTLVDTVPDITLAVAELMAADGLAPFSQDEVRLMVGRGLGVLVDRAYAARGAELDAAAMAERARRMAEDIYPNYLTGASRAMRGAANVLEQLRRRGLLLAVVTNKLQRAATTVLTHYGLAGDLSLIVGEHPREPALRLKPAPDMLLFALEQMGVRPEQAVMVGDSESDIASSQAAGIFALGVEGGYPARPLAEAGPDLLVPRLDAVPLALA